MTAASLLAEAVMSEGKWTQKMAAYGGERRGAPVLAFVRISDDPIRSLHRIYEPDCIVVLDPVLPYIVKVTDGLKKGGTAILNSRDPPEKVNFDVELSKIATVDATGIALELFGPRAIPITNTTMLGAIAGATGWVTLNSLYDPVKKTFLGDVGERNIEAIKMGYKRVKVKEFRVGG